MRCPFCDETDLRVLDTRKDSNTITRIRKCNRCHRRFNTVERISAHELTVRKRNGKVEPFSRAKLGKALRKAASTQNLTPEQIDGFIDRLLERMQYESDDSVVTSELVGQLVLRLLDDGTEETDVARTRFALVFLGKTTRHDGFRTADDAADWMRTMYERLGEVPEATTGPVTIIKRQGQRQDFDPAKLERSVGIAAKGRGRDEEVRTLATEVAAQVMRSLTGEAIVSSQQVAASVMRVLRSRDQIAYLRYASITKPFRSVDDFWLELSALRADLTDLPSVKIGDV